MDEEESSHIDSEDNNTLVVIDIPMVEKEGKNITYSTMPMGLILTEKNIITVSIRDNSVVDEFSRGLVKGVQTNLKTRFLLHIMLRVATRYLQYLKQIDKISNYVETELRESMKNSEPLQLLDIEKSLVYFSSSLKGNEITLEKIMRGRVIKLYDEDQDLLEDVLIEVKQAIEMSNIYLNILSGTMDAFASVISEQSEHRHEGPDFHHAAVRRPGRHHRDLRDECQRPAVPELLVPGRSVRRLHRGCVLGPPPEKNAVIRADFVI